MNQQLSFHGAGVRLAASAFGDPSAPPILFLHASCQSRWAWEAAAGMVAQQGFYGIAIDLRGHGDSEWAPDGDYSAETIASDIVAVLDQLNQPVTIVGNSLGGLTALAVGAQRRDRIRLLVSFDAAPTMTLPGNSKFLDFFDLAAQGFDSVEQAAKEMEVRFDRPIRDIERFRTRFVETNGRVYFRWDPNIASIRAGCAPEYPGWLLGLLKGFDRPAVLMLAEQNSLVSEYAIQQLRTALPQLLVERWLGTRHGMTTRDSLGIASRTLSHLKQLDDNVRQPEVSVQG